MEPINIYISLIEAENLIFNKNLMFEKNRLTVKKAQGLLSVVINVDGDKLFEYKNRYIILFSAVLFFEIPEKEQNLFVNHYRVPLGLLEYSSRNIRDTSKNQIIFEEQCIDYNSRYYQLLRSGFVGICNSLYANDLKSEYKLSAQTVLCEFTSLSDIRRRILVELFEQAKFPILTVKTDKFATDKLFRVVWWGKFIVDNYLNKLENKNLEELELVKKWIREFLHFDNIESVNRQLKHIPEVLKDEIDFLLGYYFVAFYFESLQNEKDFIKTLVSEIDYKNKNILLNWIFFFNSMFNENILYLYFVKSLDDEVFKIEKLAFELANNNLECLQNYVFNIELKEINQTKLLSDFLMLKFGGKNHNPKLITRSEAINLFKNSFSSDNLRINGFELKSEFENNDRLLNSCWLNKRQFHLNINADVNPCDIVFFVNENSKAKEKLKSLKIKDKPYSKLIEKNKKVLLCFLKDNGKSNFLALYSAFLNDEILQNFKVGVFVLLVNMDTEIIQSLEFNNYKNEKVKELRTLFNIPIELIIKNESNKNDVEIKRSLKNVLKKYKMEQIEVVAENFDEEKAQWLIDCNTEYLIQNDEENYYSISNLF